MRLLIEDYQYDAKDVADVLEGLFTLQDIDNKIAVNYVGYYYNPKIQDCVFILPKVIIDEHELVFSKYDPSKLIHLEKAEVKLEEHEKKFLYDFAVWIHRAIVVFKENNDKSKIVLRRQIETEGQGKMKLSNTLLDVILALIRFNNENRSFFTFVLRNIHSGFNKINWGKTISSTSAFVQGEEPIYLNPVNKKRHVNFDEELIVIFFSILNYVGEKYGFKSETPFGFKLITGIQFDRYLNGYGARRLRQIKYKYFSDIAVKLWDLCYAFFDKNYQIKMASSQSEYLLVKSFHVVFEAIIEELIGDNDIPVGLKEQADGKLVDHFYTYQGLISNREEQNDVYYIGDSKYYKIGSNPSRESVYKQYTYARNVIQWNLNLFLPKDDNMSEEQLEARRKDKGRFGQIELRDNLTEGYNVIPNFFISADIDPKTLSYEDRTIEHNPPPPISRHFEYRLYDRDTLLLSHYDVNFLFVLALYGRNNPSAKESYKQSVREKFRESIQKMLEKNFEFYAMRAHPEVDYEEYFESHFQATLGKTFRPFGNKEIFSLALDKNDPKKEELINTLKEKFYVAKCMLGTEPESAINDEIERSSVPEYRLDNYEGQFLTCIVRKSEEGEDENEEALKLYDLFLNHQAEGKTYILLNMPTGKGSLNEVRYLLPIVDNKIDGYYEIEEIKFGERTKVFVVDGKEMKVKLPKLKIKIGEYKPFAKTYTEGIVPRMSNQIWTPEYLQEQIINKNNTYTPSDEEYLFSSEPDAKYGYEEWSEPDYIED